MEPQAEARRIPAEVAALPVPSTAPVREVRRRASRALRDTPAGEVRALARALIFDHGLRWVGYEIIAAHKAAYRTLTDADLAEMAQGLASWDAVDAYGMILAGPAWRDGLASDALIDRWAASPDRWLRRLSLVATVPPARAGETARVLAVCERHVGDRDDMVEKALSWALRELTKADRAAVERFLDCHEEVLGARVKREVRHKLTTGLKAKRRPPK